MMMMTLMRTTILKTMTMRMQMIKKTMSSDRKMVETALEAIMSYSDRCILKLPILYIISTILFA